MSNTVADAMEFARVAHCGQKYGDAPYSDHLQEVVDFLGKMNISDTSIQVAWLHDVVEDTPITYQHLRNFGFDEDVVDAIIHITKEHRETYQYYIQKVRANPISLTVKKADTICNLTHSVIEGNRRRINKYSNQLRLLFRE